MDEQTTTDDEQSPSMAPEDSPEEDETVGADVPVGADNIREGKVRGSMYGGPTHAGGEGQGG